MLTRFRRCLISAIMMVLSPAMYAAWELNMPQGVTEVSQSVYDLHMLILWICVGIGVIVFGVMFYSIIRHRKSRGVKAAQFHESLSLEILWTAIPTVILIAMAVPATTTLINMYDPSDADIDIKITGYQWKWQYEYMGENVSFFSNLTTSDRQIHNQDEKGSNYLLEVDNRLVIPTGKKIRFLLTSNDVIHAWWVPALAVKKDAIPGYINESWTQIESPGIYRGQCTELCGVDHGFMPIVVEAVSPQDYQVWLDAQRSAAQAQSAAAQQDWSYDQLMARGEQVYASQCSACHGANGEGLGSVFPALKDSPVATTGSVERHIDIILNGVSGTAMQAFAAQLSSVDVAAVTTYERNAWGNNTGDVITPKQIVDAKQ
jgi:cytochrome c oxidase subunit 2